MTRKVAYEKYGKLEGKIISIKPSIFLACPQLAQYFRDIIIEKEVENGDMISTCVKRRKANCKDLKVGDYVCF